MGAVGKSEKTLFNSLTISLGLNEIDARQYFINGSGNIIGYHHVDIFDSLFHPLLSFEERETLREMYVCLAGAIFATERIMDGQSKNIANDVLISQQCIARSMKLAFDIGIHKEEITPALMEELMIIFSTNRGVLLKERNDRLDLDDGFDVARNAVSAFERGYLFLSLYRIVSMMKGMQPSQDVEGIIKDFLYYMQEGDDLGDWREDFESGRRTPILKRATSSIEGVPALSDVESFVYLSGFYEAEAQGIIRGLRDVVERTGRLGRDFHGSTMIEFIEKQIERISAVSNNFRRVKSGMSPLPIPNTGH